LFYLVMFQRHMKIFYDKWYYSVVKVYEYFLKVKIVDIPEFVSIVSVKNVNINSIKGLLNDQIKMNLDGSGKPIKGIWNNEDKKRYATGFGFISVLFPQWFDTDALSIIEDEVYDYDYDKLGEYLDGWLEKYLPKHHRMFKMFYGLDDIYSKPKKISEIARFYGMKAQTVRKQKQRLLHKLRMHDTALNELAFYVSTNGIKSQSKVYDWAEINLKIFRD